jgi:hypothetical protein
VFDIASEQDLLRLKKTAKADRSAPGDAEDIAFLQARGKNSARRVSARSLDTETWGHVACDGMVPRTKRGKLRPIIFTGAFLPV